MIGTALENCGDVEIVSGGFSDDAGGFFCIVSEDGWVLNG